MSGKKQTLLQSNLNQFATHIYPLTAKCTLHKNNAAYIKQLQMAYGQRNYMT